MAPGCNRPINNLEIWAMAKTLDLSDKAQEALSEVLEKALRDLSYEISDTDLYSYKQELKDRRDVLKAIADQLKE